MRQSSLVIRVKAVQPHSQSLTLGHTLRQTLERVEVQPLPERRELPCELHDLLRHDTPEKGAHGGDPAAGELHSGPDHVSFYLLYRNRQPVTVAVLVVFCRRRGRLGAVDLFQQFFRLFVQPLSDFQTLSNSRRASGLRQLSMYLLRGTVAKHEMHKLNNHQSNK